MIDAVVTPDIAIPPPEAPADQAETPAPPPPAVPNVEDEEPPDRRRRLLLLFLLLALLFLLLAFAVWYFLFRQPIENLIPNLDLTKPPAYQLSTYGLSKPLGVAVSADGSKIYVTQGGGDGSTLLIDPAGNHIATLAPPESVTTRATQLYVAINPKTGDVYATSRANGAVYVYAADGTYRQAFDPGSNLAIWQPLAIAFDADGNLYVSDAGGDYQTVHVFGPDGSWLRDLGSPGLFAFPNGIAIDANGNVYVSDSNNGRLVVFDKTGTQLGTIQRGTADGELGMPRGVAIDGQGRVYVVDAVGQTVQMFRALQANQTAPAYLARFGREGTVEGAFEYPNDVAVDGRGRIYVTDWNNDRLQLWSY
jgi:DNA-binding beta-propeller fold protein YncE